MPETHAKLSASGAKRWMACPPSVSLENEFPDRTSSYAEEGTLAHSLAELILRYNNGEMTKRTFLSRKKKLQENDLYKDEMLNYIEDYAQKVREMYNEAKAKCKDAEIMFEQRLDFSGWVEEGFGTGDVVIISDGTLEIIDLKYGKGVGVSAIENPQLRLYALGAVDTYGLIYDIDKVKMTIIQPRLEHQDTEEMSVSSLIKWGDEEVKPRAELAYKGEGDFKAGDHCRFCKAKGVCKARALENLKLAQYDFREPKMLTPAEISDILTRGKDYNKWLEDVREYALDAAANRGIGFPGWKVVEGRSVRQYKDEKLIEDALNGLYPEEKTHTKKLKGITEMTKLLGKEKFEQLLGAFVIKPQGAPTLAPETDKRPALGADSAKNDFDDL